jgi:uncharacterized RDD family membrane protein YckC
MEPAHEASGGKDARDFAGLASRTLAFAADAAVINGVIWFVALVVTAWTVAYFVFFWSASGQTPGNRLLGLRVAHRRTGRPLRARRALLRVLAVPLSALPLCAGFLLILIEPRRRALHDVLTGTVVVYEGERPAHRRD